MKKRGTVIIIVTILILTTTLQIEIHASTPEGLIEQAEKELTEVLRILDKIELAEDGSLESITTQLNQALKLLEEAKHHASEERVTEANASAEEALSLIKRAKIKAQSTLEASTQRASQTLMLSWSLVPVASILTALAATRGYEWYVKREHRKLLNMTIIRKRRKTKDV